VAFALQFWGIHGKKGLRKRLSTIERTDEGKTQASGHSLKIETDKEGRRTIYLDLPTDPDFDMLEFRRALYRIALSTVAMLEGADYALDPKFDEARRYIRNPKTGEAWSFAQGQTPLPSSAWAPERARNLACGGFGRGRVRVTCTLRFARTLASSR
jgi:hypothetical protein